MTDIQKEIKEALAAATPGPWIDGKSRYNVITPDGKMICEVWGSRPDGGINTPLIANAPTWLLHQQELIEQLRTEILDQRKLFQENAARLAKLSEDSYIREMQEQLEHKDAEIEKLREIQRLLVLSQLNTHE